MMGENLWSDIASGFHSSLLSSIMLLIHGPGECNFVALSAWKSAHHWLWIALILHFPGLLVYLDLAWSWLHCDKAKPRRVQFCKQLINLSSLSSCTINISQTGQVNIFKSLYCFPFPHAIFTFCLHYLLYSPIDRLNIIIIDHVKLLSVAVCHFACLHHGNAIISSTDLIITGLLMWE